MLFPIRQLIEEQDDLLTVTNHTKVRDALALMIEHDYSQLPIINERGVLTGMITEQSIINSYFHVGNKVNLLDVNVDQCQTEPVRISPDEDIFDALEPLKKVYAVVVVEDQKPIGIVTDYDTTNFFRNYSEGLIQIQDIEVTLRQHIEAVLDTENAMNAALVRAFDMDRKEPEKPAKEYSDLSFWDHIQLIITDENWGKFERIFQPKPMFEGLMGQVRDIRNQLAHFRGQLDAVQNNALEVTIDWLAGRPKTPTQAVTLKVEHAYHGHTAEEIQLVLQKSKYAPLEGWLIGETGPRSRIQVSFEDIETVLDEDLPESARKHRAWWANDITHTQAKAWLRAGWLVDDVDLQAEHVTFLKSKSAYYQVFFTELLTQLKAISPGVTQTQKASLQNYLSFSSGISGFAFGWALPREPVLRVELYIDKGDKGENKAVFDMLKDQRSEIENQIGETLIWDRLDDNKASRISATMPFRITDPSDRHEEAKEWGVSMMLKFIDTFQPIIRM